MTFNLAKSAHRLEALPRPQFAAASMTAILLIGVLDHLTGAITSLTIFYLMPQRRNACGSEPPDVRRRAPCADPMSKR